MSKVINGKKYYEECEVQTVVSDWEAKYESVERDKKSVEIEKNKAEQRIAEITREQGANGEQMFPDKYYNRGYAIDELKDRARCFGRVVKALSVIQADENIEAGFKELDQVATEYKHWYEPGLVNKTDMLQSKLAGGSAGRVIKAGSPAAFSEASNGAGLFTVPQFWSDYVYNLVPLFGWARRLARVVPMPAQTVNLSVGGPVVTSWPGNNTAAPLFDATNFFTQVQAVASTMAAAQYVQLEYLQDTSVPILQYLTEQTANAIAREEDRQVFSGNGAPFTGITNLTGTHVTYLGGNQYGGLTSVMGAGNSTNIHWTDLVQAQFQLNTKALGGACFFGNQRTYAALRSDASATRPTWNFSEPALMADQQGIARLTGFNVKSPLQGYAGFWEPMGIPFAVIDSTPDLNGNTVLPDPTVAGTAAVILANLQNIFFGVRQDILLSVFREQYGGEDLAGQRQIALVTWERVAVATPLPGAFEIIKTDLS